MRPTVTISTHGLSAMQVGRLNKALEALVRIDGVVMSWRDYALTTVRKRETDGMADYSRTRFNRMNGREQAAYMARLQAKRVYILEDAEGYGRAVAKVIYDAVTYEDAGEVEAAAAWTEEDSAALFGSAPTASPMAERLAHQRDVKANACRMNARAHGVESHWGRVYMAEAAQWDEAARRARMGDLSPFTLSPVEGATSTAADYEADGADARAHGYGADRNPFTWDARRGPELDANRVKREAWARGHSRAHGMPDNAPHNAFAAVMAKPGRAIDWDVIAPARPGFGG